LRSDDDSLAGAVVVRDAHGAAAPLLLLLARVLRRSARVNLDDRLLRRPMEAFTLQVVVAGEAHAGDDQSEQESFHREAAYSNPPTAFLLVWHGPASGYCARP
jgi:hypothetical protein